MALFKPSAEDRKTYEGMSVAILTPCKDYEVPFRFARAVANVVSYSWMNGLKVFEWGGTERTVVHWARNDLCRQVKDWKSQYTGEEFTHVLWLDDDHVFNPDLLLYLAKNGDKDVVSALYYGRAQQHLPVVYVKDDTDDKYKHFPLLEVPAELCEVDAIGFGACLMRRDVLDRMPDPYFAFTPGVGEDVYFCVHAKEHGIKIWCDGSYIIGHIGDPSIVTQETYRQYMADNEERFGDRIKVPLGGQKSWLRQFGKKAS